MQRLRISLSINDFKRKEKFFSILADFGKGLALLEAVVEAKGFPNLGCLKGGERGLR